MDKLLITGGQPLVGMVPIHGAKNAALPILAASLLCDGCLSLENLPPLEDTKSMIKLLHSLGVSTLEKNKTAIMIDASAITHYQAPEYLVKAMRASILILGPLLSRYGYAKIPLPGGCAIGDRPVDQHILGLRAMGAEITVEKDCIVGVSKKLKGAHIVMQSVSVTGTENIMMAASLAEGDTIIENAAQEPEVVDLANCLIKMGAHIQGQGTKKILITGVKTLNSTSYTIMPDRIEASTYLIAACATRGCVSVTQVEANHLSSVLLALEKAGADIDVSPHTIRLDMKGKRPLAVNISTAPYPGIATDVQAQFCALNSIAKGQAYIEENIFENRFMHCQELIKMGANITVKGDLAFIQGVNQLNSASVWATDLRASASLVIAGLLAEGRTEVNDIYHMDRGYSCLEEKIRQLGGCVERVFVDALVAT